MTVQSMLRTTRKPCRSMQVGPEPDPTRDYTQHHHISLGGTREGPWAAQEASPWPRRWSDSSWDTNREEYFLVA